MFERKHICLSFFEFLCIYVCMCMRSCIYILPSATIRALFITRIYMYVLISVCLSLCDCGICLGTLKLRCTLFLGAWLDGWIRVPTYVCTPISVCMFIGWRAWKHLGRWTDHYNTHPPYSLNYEMNDRLISNASRLLSFLIVSFSP